MYDYEVKICPYCNKEKKSGIIPIIDKVFYQKCECEIEAEGKEAAKRKAEAEEKYIETRIRLSHLPKKEQAARFDTMIVDSENEQAVKAAKYISESLINGTKSNKNGLILYGNTGSGKTYLAAAIINEYNRCTLDEYIIESLVNGIDKHRISSPCKFIKEYDLLKLSSRYYRENNPLDEYKKAKILVIDDIGTSAANDEERKAVLHSIIDHRYSEDLSTIITTNLKSGELKNYLGDRSFDRLESSCFLMPLTATKSRRKAAKS